MKRGKAGQYDVTAIGGETVRAFVPSPLPPTPSLVLDGPLHQLLERAILALGRLFAHRRQRSRRPPVDNISPLPRRNTTRPIALPESLLQAASIRILSTAQCRTARGRLGGLGRVLPRRSAPNCRRGGLDGPTTRCPISGRSRSDPNTRTGSRVGTASPRCAQTTPTRFTTRDPPANRTLLPGGFQRHLTSHRIENRRRNHREEAQSRIRLYPLSRYPQ